MELQFSIEIWKETERQINERFRTNIEIKYHNVIMDFNPEKCKNHNGFTPGTLIFTHYTSARQRYAPHDLAVRQTTVKFKE